MEHLLSATNKVVELNNQLAAVTEQLTAAREELAELKEEYGTWWAQKRIAIDELKEVTEQRDRLAAALQKLADCDWVITLPDRMDAVRSIARDALAAVKGGADDR